MNRDFSPFLSIFASKSKERKGIMGNKETRSRPASNKKPESIDERIELLNTIKVMVEKEVERQLGKEYKAASTAPESQKKDQESSSPQKETAGKTA